MIKLAYEEMGLFQHDKVTVMERAIGLNQSVGELICCPLR